MSVDKNLHRIIRRLQGRLPEKEGKDLDQWLQDPEHSALEDDLKGVWSMGGAYKAGYKPDVEKGLSLFKSRLKETKASPEKTMGRRYEMKSGSNWLNKAATIALLIGFGFMTVYLLQPSSPEMMAITTANDEKKEVQLSDGSKVILNENSKLVFPSSFGKSRQVRLSGEGYFSITKDPDKPFAITCPNAFVEVLGTAFNLRAYPDENYSEVEVESGKVRLSGPNKEQPLILGPKQRGRINSGQDNQNLNAENVPVLNAQAWRTHRLDFRGDNMVKVVDLLERYYGAEIDFGDTPLRNCSYTSQFEREPLKNVLEDFEIAFGAKVKKRAKNQYEIIGGSCKNN